MDVSELLPRKINSDLDLSFKKYIIGADSDSEGIFASLTYVFLNGSTTLILKKILKSPKTRN